MSILVLQVFPPIFPYKFLTVAYTTMTYNEYHKIYWNQLIFRNKFLEKKEGKMNKNLKYRTLQAVKIGLL